MEVCNKKMTSVIELIKMFYSEGFFSEWRSAANVKNHLQEKGFNFNYPLILMSLSNATKQGVLSKRGKKGKWEYSQRQPPETKIKENEIKELNKIFSDLTSKKLGDRFQQDIKELNIAFTYDCGNSSAFILRKILEKAIFYVLSTKGKSILVKGGNGKSPGLESLINLCSQEEINGIPILLPKTAKELLGMKFLGDSAAHDYLANVEVIEINRQLPYWTMAIKELINNFN